MEISIIIINIINEYFIEKSIKKNNVIYKISIKYILYIQKNKIGDS